MRERFYEASAAALLISCGQNAPRHRARRLRKSAIRRFLFLHHAGSKLLSPAIRIGFFALKD